MTRCGAVARGNAPLNRVIERFRLNNYAYLEHEFRTTAHVFVILGEIPARGRKRAQIEANAIVECPNEKARGFLPGHGFRNYLVCLGEAQAVATLQRVCVEDAKREILRARSVDPISRGKREGKLGKGNKARVTNDAAGFRHTLTLRPARSGVKREIRFLREV